MRLDSWPGPTWFRKTRTQKERIRGEHVFFSIANRAHSGGRALGTPLRSGGPKGSSSLKAEFGFSPSPL